MSITLIWNYLMYMNITLNAATISMETMRYIAALSILNLSFMNTNSSRMTRATKQN